MAQPMGMSRSPHRWRAAKNGDSTQLLNPEKPNLEIFQVFLFIHHEFAWLERVLRLPEKGGLWHHRAKLLWMVFFHSGSLEVEEWNLLPFRASCKRPGGDPGETGQDIRLVGCAPYPLEEGQIACR